MTRRNASQMDLLDYRARAPKPKARKLAAVKVKFGPPDGSPGYGRSMDIRARRGSGDWQDVGWVDTGYEDLNDNIMGDSEDFRVGGYDATLYGEDDEFSEFSVEVLRGDRDRDRWWAVRTTVEAKRMIKAWAVKTLEARAWEG